MMTAVQIRELDKLIVDLLSQDHPEITEVGLLDKGHSRVRVEFASGAVVTIMVRDVRGPGVPSHAPYDLPEAVIWLRRKRFVDHMRDLLVNSGHPGIETVGSYRIDPDLEDIEITCTDGRVIRLNITRMSPPGGDKFTEPEVIVTKHRTPPAQAT